MAGAGEGRLEKASPGCDHGGSRVDSAGSEMRIGDECWYVCGRIEMRLFRMKEFYKSSFA